MTSSNGFFVCLFVLWKFWVYFPIVSYSKEISLGNATVRQMDCRGPWSAQESFVLMEGEFKHCFVSVQPSVYYTPLWHVDPIKFSPSDFVNVLLKPSEISTNHSRWRARRDSCGGFFSLLCGRISRFSRRRFLAASLCRVLTQAVSERTTQSNMSSWVCSDSFTLKC